jgi:AcrR family transcriptional regulator
MNSYVHAMTRSRSYTLQRRAEAQADTHRRILDAAVALHGSAGPARTSISAIAEAAGVQRLTVYRHFPDEVALFHGCTAHWLASHPLPEPDAWSGPEDPAQRCEQALQAHYAYYRDTADMWRLSLRDLDLVPALQQPMQAVQARFDAIAADLLRGFAPARGRRAALRATLRHGLAFATWDSLQAQGLGDAAAARLVAGWAHAAA